MVWTAPLLQGRDGDAARGATFGPLIFFNVHAFPTLQLPKAPSLARQATPLLDATASDARFRPGALPSMSSHLRGRRTSSS